MKKVKKNKAHKNKVTKNAPIKKREEESKLDRALEETFPASDPITLY